VQTPAPMCSGLALTMSTRSLTLDHGLLRQIRSLEMFSDNQLDQLACHLQLQSARGSERILHQGYSVNDSLYILDGEATSRAIDGSVQLVRSRSGGYFTPIARRRPSIYDIEAVSSVRFLRLNNDLLSRFSQSLSPEADSIQVDIIDQGEESNELTRQLCMDIFDGKVALPPMPDIVYKIEHAFANENSDVGTISKLIQSDPAISAKLLKVANSPIYRGNSPIESLHQAIVRIGMDIIRKQVIIYAATELFRAKTQQARARMQQLWKDSRRIAAFSRVLATKSGRFNPEQAQMAGLLCDLGVIAILNYIQQHDHLQEKEAQLEKTVLALRPLISALLLQKWNLSKDLIRVAEESNNWFRNPGPEADLCDLVLVARYHSYLGSRRMDRLPLLAKMPAFFKLGLNMDPHMSLDFIRQSQAQVSAVEQMLGSI
jgi:HD-like signal output (HDOD) protein